MSIESVSEDITQEYWTLEEIKNLPQILPGAFYVMKDDGEGWDFCFRITREFRPDQSKAQHPQITASRGGEKISLVLSKSHGWYINFHNGNMELNRRVLRFLNKGALSIAEDVIIAIGEDPEKNEADSAE